MGKMKKLIIVILTVLVTLGVAIPVSSEAVKTTGILESAGNLFIGDINDVNEVLNSDNDVYVFGNTVDLSGKVDGALIVLGNYGVNIDTEEVSGSIRALSNIKLELKSNKVKNITAASPEIYIKRGTVSRGVYLAGIEIEFAGEADEVRVIGETVVIKGKINGDLHVDCTSLIIEEGAEISGNIFVKASNRPIVKNDFDQNKIEFERIENKYKEEKFTSKLLGVIPSIITAILFVIILLILFRKSSEKLVEVTENKFIATGFIGFATLIILPIISFISMITIVAIPVAIIALIIYGILIYLAPIITAIIITGKYLKNRNKLIFVPIVVGVIKILCIIPIVGGIVYFICILFSLGSFILKIIDNIKNN